MARNLIKNSCGEDGLQYWEDIHSGGDGWKVENFREEREAKFPFDSVKKFFATSYKWCMKSQVIDLLHEGYTEELLDKSQPCIVISDWYSSRSDCGGRYELIVELLSDKRELITEHNSGNITVPESEDNDWQQIGHTFSRYGPGVRFIRFKHGAQDSKTWKGWYGVRVTKSSVKIECFNKHA